MSRSRHAIPPSRKAAIGTLSCGVGLLLIAGGVALWRWNDPLIKLWAAVIGIAAGIGTQEVIRGAWQWWRWRGWHAAAGKSGRAVGAESDAPWGPATRGQHLFLDQLAQRLLGRPFRREDLEQLHRDGGPDMDGVTLDELSDAIGGRFAGDWPKLVTACAGLLAYYATLHDGLTSAQVVAWAAGALVLAEAIDQRAAVGKDVLNPIIDSFQTIRPHLGEDEAMWILRRALGEATV